MQNLAIISCIFGLKYNKVYPAPLNNHSYFYTNNPKLESEITSNGWIYKYVNAPLHNDFFKNSMIAKSIKFLQNYPKEYKYILYIDHKLYITPEIIQELFSIRTKPVVIRKSPAHKNILTELELASYQKRYRDTMPQLKSYVDKMVIEGFTTDSVICATGFILWDTHEPKALELAQHLYDGVIEANNPECQVVFALWRQKYEDIIQIILWNDINIVWKLP